MSDLMGVRFRTQHVRDTLHASTDKYLASMHKEHVDRYVTIIWEPEAVKEVTTTSRPVSSSASSQNSPKLEISHTIHYSSHPYKVVEVPPYKKEGMRVIAPNVMEKMALPYWHLPSTIYSPPAGDTSRWQELQNVVNAQLQATTVPTTASAHSSPPRPPFAAIAASAPPPIAARGPPDNHLWRPFDLQ